MIRVLSIMEATFVTGPAKNLIEFAQRSKTPDADLPAMEFSVATYQRGQDSANPFVDAARAAGIPVDIIHETGRFDRSVLPQLRAIVAARRPDIIQTHNVKSHFLLRASGLWKTHRWIGFQHGYTTTDFKMRCYNQLDRWSLRAPHHLITVCEAFADDLVRQGSLRNRITVQHNSIKPFAPLDPEIVRNLRKTLPASASILLTVGRLSHEKGHLDLLQALASIRRQWPDDAFHLVIAGEGPERPAIEAAIASEGLASHVTLAGLQHDIRPYYAVADLVVMPSHSEGSPNALLEAMIASKPIVATRAGGIPEIVENEQTAILVEPRRPAALADAVHRLLHDPETSQRLAANAYTLASTQFSPAAYRRKMGQLYCDVLGNRTAELRPVA
jgi:glycosyltransferase involved in cell wall biosynthesis